VEIFEEAGDEAVCEGGVRGEEFGAGGEGAVGGVDGDLLDEASLLCGGGGVAGLGEVEGGDLEAVEEEAGAAGVELVGGEAVEDLADGLLDGAAVFGDGDGEGGGLVLALGEVDGEDGGAGVGAAVVEAEVIVEEAGAAAAAAVGEDVAALVAAWVDGDGGVRHGGYPSPGYFVVKVFDRCGLRRGYLEVGEAGVGRLADAEGGGRSGAGGLAQEGEGGLGAEAAGGELVGGEVGFDVGMVMVEVEGGLHGCGSFAFGGLTDESPACAGLLFFSSSSILAGRGG